MRLLLNLGRKDRGRQKDFVEMLELLPCLLFIRIRHRITIYLSDIRESIHNECPEEDGVRYLVALDRERCQALERFKFRNLNETVNIVILE